MDYASAVSDALPNVQKAAIHATHSDMCKFDSEEAPGYEIVVAALIQFCEAAPEAIATKWMHDRQSSYLSHQYRVGDIIKTANRSKSSIFI